MSPDAWVNAAIQVITLIVTSVLLSRLANRTTKVIVLDAAPEENTKSITGQKAGKSRSRNERMVFWALVLMACAQFYLSGLDFYVLFRSAGPYSKAHLVMAASATTGILSGFFLSVVIASGAWRNLLRLEDRPEAGESDGETPDDQKQAQ